MTKQLQKALKKKQKPKVSDTIERDLRVTPATVMAALAGCSTAHLRRLTNKGEIKQVEGLMGKYDAYAVLAYFRQEEDFTSPMQEAKLNEVLEKTRKDRLINDEKERLLISVTEVSEFTHQYAGMFVQSIESVRKKIGALVNTKTRIKLDEQCREARHQLQMELESFRNNCTRTSNTTTESERSEVG